MRDLPPSPGKAPRRTVQPYLDWAVATRFSYLRKGDWIPLLIEFDVKAVRTPPGNEELNALKEFATRRWLADDPRELDETFIIPELFTEPPALLRSDPDFNFCVGLIRRDVDVVRALTNSARWNRTVVRLELGPPIDIAREPAPALVAVRPSTPLAARSHAGLVARVSTCIRHMIDWIRSLFRGEKPMQSMPSTSGGSAAEGRGRIGRVVVAIIDQGIAFANARFFTAGASRIEYLWQQNVLGTVMPAPALSMPFTPGFELDRVAIQNAIAAANAVGAGEDWVYQNFGGLTFGVDGYKPLARRRTHGTHVLDLAAGGINSGQHPIIAVDMPEDAVGDPAGSTLSVQAAWGLVYILDRAALLRRPDETLPVVANLSYGPHEGPHDGTALLEDFMDRIWQMANGSNTPLEIVLAAGNSRQTRTHAAFDLPPARRTNLRWRLQPGSLSASLMEIWLPQVSGLNVMVTLTPPNTSAALPPVSVSPAQLTDAFTPGGNEVYSARYVPAAAPAVADSIVLSIARTAPDPAGAWGDAVAPSGVWRVTLSSATAVQGIRSWIRRSDTLSGRRARGRQSYFDDPRYTRFGRTPSRPRDFDPAGATSYVRRVQTLSGIATGQTTRVIGGYRNSDFYPAFYSSHGTRTLGGVPTGPDWLACCDESAVLPGVHGAGTRTGSVVAMNGTSVAAPQATRWIATEWLVTGTRPGQLPTGSFVPTYVFPERPIPLGELPFAFGNGLAPFEPRWPPRREI